jgi:hypothetical protein
MRLHQAVFLPFVAIAPVFAQNAGTDAEPAYDLRVEPRPDQPLLAELRLGMQVTIEATSGGKRKKLEFEHQSRLDFVEELLARDKPEAGDMDVRRTFLLWEEDGTDERGKMIAQDNAFGGAQALITLRKSEIGLELLNRLAPEKELEILLKLSESVSWLKMPASARVGETFETDPTGLVNLLLNGGFLVQSARGTFTLRSVDENGVATLDGSLVVMGDAPDNEGHGTFEGTCSVAIDTRAKLVQRAQWKGQARLQMDDGEVRGEGKGAFDSRLSVTTGDPARRALGRKTTYRAVLRSPEKVPVVFELPSHWYSVAGEEVETFRTTVHGHEAPVTLELQAFAVSSQEFDSVLDSAVGQMGRDVHLTSQRPMTSPLGKGRSLRFQTKAEDGSTVAVLVEFYPCGKSQLLRVRLSGPPDALEEELDNWPKIVRTLSLRK